MADEDGVEATCPECGHEFIARVDLSNVETIAPTRIEFDLDANSAAMVAVEHEGEDVLCLMPGGHFTAFGEAITAGQIASALRRYLDERFEG